MPVDHDVVRASLTAGYETLHDGASPKGDTGLNVEEGASRGWNRLKADQKAGVARAPAVSVRLKSEPVGSASAYTMDLPTATVPVSGAGVPPAEASESAGTVTKIGDAGARMLFERLASGTRPWLSASTIT